jgi:hypothetical protein
VQKRAKSGTGKSSARGPTDLKSKVQDVLNEARILVLGTQVLLGFQYQAVFYPGFERLPDHSKWANLIALCLNLIVFALVVAPGPYHRIAESGDNTRRLKHFSARMIAAALPLLACALGIDLAFISEKEVGSVAALLLGSGFIVGALTLWIIMGVINRMQQPGKPAINRQTASVGDKIQTLLTEARVILPGAQALLGFQFAAMLTDRFQTLPSVSRIVHVASLFAIALAVILLIAPAAYHRLAADGEPRLDVDVFGARAVLGALIPLALGLAGDLYVVAEMQFVSAILAIGLPVLALVVFVGSWAVYPVIARKAEVKS